MKKSITGKSLIRALAKVVFPDPGGPTRRITLWTAVEGEDMVRMKSDEKEDQSVFLFVKAD